MNYIHSIYRFKALHVLNRTRLAFMRTAIEQQLDLPEFMPAPFKNVDILDVGCGGGNNNLFYWLSSHLFSSSSSSSFFLLPSFLREIGILF